MTAMKNKEMPAFKSESEEADWWASRPGRDYVKQKSAEAQAARLKMSGSRVVDKLNKKSSVQIAIGLPEADIEQARKIASASARESARHSPVFTPSSRPVSRSASPAIRPIGRRGRSSRGRWR